MPRNISNKYGSIFCKSLHFCAWCIYPWNCKHDISDFLIFYLTTTWSKISVLMLDLLDLYFSGLIFVSAGEIANNICQLILITTTFQLKLKMRKISNICVSIMCTYQMLIGTSICGSNIQHSMLSFPKVNTVLCRINDR